MQPIIVGAFGDVPKCLTRFLSQFGFDNIVIREIISKMQNISVSGTVKIRKTFLIVKAM